MSGAASDDTRERVAAAFQDRCAYCRAPLVVFPAARQIDHILPRALGGTDDDQNLCIACPWCNQRKASRVAALDPLSRQTVALFNPRIQRWAEHFAWSSGAIHIRGLTACGRATVGALNMNADDQVCARRIWVLAGWHPPGDEFHDSPAK